MFDTEIVSEDLRQSTSELIKVLDAIPSGVINLSPGEKSWSVGQVIDHLLKLEFGVGNVLGGPTNVAKRDPGEKVEKIKEVFLNFDKKLSAGGPVKPSDEQFDKQALKERIAESRKKLDKIVLENNMDLIYTGFKHPLFGTLSGEEWVYFNIYHTQRHLQQIQRIVEVVKN